MRCIVTAGPTYEKLDDVRRLTNFSTGRLGTELAAKLKSIGHKVVLLIGEQSTWRGERVADDVREFSTTDDLTNQLSDLGGDNVDAVFHASAVSDFSFGNIYKRSSSGELNELTEGKVSTRDGVLMAELVPTHKIISKLREFFPRALLVGWKYEVDGARSDVIAKAVKQIRDNDTTACVGNGAAYGNGFGIVNRCGGCKHVEDRDALFDQLLQLVSK